MTIDEVKKEALKLLWNSSQSAGKSTFTISGVLLAEHNLDTNTFWTLICPRLVKNGILTEAPRADYGEMIPVAEDKWMEMNKHHITYSFSVDENKLLTAVNQKDKPESVEKITINIDEKTGIYLSDGELNYPIHGKRFDIVEALFEGEASGSDLKKITGWSASDVSRSISKLNKLFKEKLKMVNNLIDHNPTGGYFLNRVHYEINFNDK